MSLRQSVRAIILVGIIGFFIWIGLTGGAFFFKYISSPEWRIYISASERNLLLLSVSSPDNPKYKVIVETSELVPEGFNSETVVINRKASLRLPAGLVLNHDLTIKPGRITIQAGSQMVVFQKSGVFINGVFLSWNEASASSPLLLSKGVSN